jgi:hypothetical protein
MEKSASHFTPKRKIAIVRQLSDECLVCDKETNKAHCLNRTATDVWNLCDGKNTVAEIVRILERKSKSPVHENIVWIAITELQKSGLLLNRSPLPASKHFLSRREMVRKMGATAAMALPVVASILIPTPAEAASCLHNGVRCFSNAECCSHICFVNCIGG